MNLIFFKFLNKFKAVINYVMEVMLLTFYVNYYNIFLYKINFY